MFDIRATLTFSLLLHREIEKTMEVALKQHETTVAALEKRTFELQNMTVLQQTSQLKQEQTQAALTETQTTLQRIQKEGELLETKWKEW